jgi:RNA polymerase sigma-70 factor (ECF subfamily)
METLDIGLISDGGIPAEREMRPIGTRGAHTPRDRERENGEDLILFREFLAGRSMNTGSSAEGARIAREAFTKIYLRYRERVYAYALRVLSNSEDAEDLFQEVFYRVFTRAASFEEEKSLGGWIFTIAHNLCLNKIRDRKPQDGLDNPLLYTEPGEDFGENWKEVIARAIASLPVEYREVIVLHEYEGMTYLEMTEILQTTIPAIKSRIYRAKGRLRELLAPYYV